PTCIARHASAIAAGVSSYAAARLESSAAICWAPDRWTFGTSNAQVEPSSKDTSSTPAIRPLSTLALRTVARGAAAITSSVGLGLNAPRLALHSLSSSRETDMWAISPFFSGDAPSVPAAAARSALRAPSAPNSSRPAVAATIERTMPRGSTNVAATEFCISCAKTRRGGRSFQSAGRRGTTNQPGADPEVADQPAEAGDPESDRVVDEH